MEPVMEMEWVLRQNTPFRQKNELMTLLTESKGAVNSSMLDTLYGQINSVRHVDFGEIDKSKGNRDRLSFSKEVNSALGYLQEGTDLVTVKTAWSNIDRLGKAFEDAYRVGADLAILTYETMVMAVLDGISTLIAQAAATVVKSKASVSRVSIEVLGRFNAAVKKGTVAKMIKDITNASLAKTGAKSATKEEFGALAIGAIAVTAMLIVPLVRELIFYFYYARMRVNQYVEQLQYYIKLNEVEVKNNKSFDKAKKDSIIEKQNDWIKRLDKVSDVIRVGQAKGEKAAKAEIQKGNKELTLDHVKADIASSDGFDFE